MSTITKIKAASEFYDLWQDLGHKLANNPQSWNEFQQQITRPESETAKKVSNALKKIEAASSHA